MNFSDLRIEEVLSFLLETDDKYAILKADVERTKHMAKRREAFEMMCADGKSAADRQAVAMIAESVTSAWDKHFDAIKEFEHVKAKRETLNTEIEAWRTWTYARKQGANV